MTLREAIEQAHCRQGKADGTTKDGAYWICSKSETEPTVIRSYGSDGVGSNAPNFTNTLELRHYRDGSVRARVHVHSWHENGSYSGAGDWYVNADVILDCATAEAVVVALKGIRSEGHGAVYSDMFKTELTTELWTLGIPAHEPAPDEGRQVEGNAIAYEYKAENQAELIRVARMLEHQGYMLTRIGEWSRGDRRVTMNLADFPEVKWHSNDIYADPVPPGADHIG